MSQLLPTVDAPLLQGDRCRLGDDCEYCHFCTEQDRLLQPGEVQQLSRKTSEGFFRSQK